ncbi:MAG: Cro/Cl family transcriptional regulator [Deltaproteobacteria bacterium]|nr:MAG: Cro/Cl family transcriptional regulator [Deltaproteobacteria bacterium]
MEKHEETALAKVGERIKKVREEKKLSLSDLAEKTGYSSAILSQIENHLLSPSLGTLIQIANALEVPLSKIFGEKRGHSYSIVRKDERKLISRFASKEGVNYGYTYESLGYDKKNRRMEPFIVTLEPATVKHQKLSSHSGEEFIYVLEGEMEVVLGNLKDTLSPGDSIYYDSTLPHRVACVGENPTKILAVLFTEA